MSKSRAAAASAPTPREKAVRRLAGLAATAVLAQAAIFLALQWLYSAVARLVLGAVVQAAHGSPPAGVDALAAAVVVVLELFTALIIGFFAARRLLAAVVRATPHPSRPPTRPIPWTSLCAGGIVAVVSVLGFAREPLVDAGWFGWLFEIARVVAIAALFWYAAARAVAPRSPR